jgi:hypothetical protein
MTETLIKTGKNFELRARVAPIPYWPGQATVELHQCFPEALNPRWQRIAQLTLNETERAALAAALTTPKE